MLFSIGNNNNNNSSGNHNSLDPNQPKPHNYHQLSVEQVKEEEEVEVEIKEEESWQSKRINLFGRTSKAVTTMADKDQRDRRQSFILPLVNGQQQHQQYQCVQQQQHREYYKSHHYRQPQHQKKLLVENGVVGKTIEDVNGQIETFYQISGGDQSWQLSSGSGVHQWDKAGPMVTTTFGTDDVCTTSSPPTTTTTTTMTCSNIGNSGNGGTMESLHNQPFGAIISHSDTVPSMVLDDDDVVAFVDNSIVFGDQYVSNDQCPSYCVVPSVPVNTNHQCPQQFAPLSDNSACMFPFANRKLSSPPPPLSSTILSYSSSSTANNIASSFRSNVSGNLPLTRLYRNKFQLESLQSKQDQRSKRKKRRKCYSNKVYSRSKRVKSTLISCWNPVHEYSYCHYNFFYYPLGQSPISEKCCAESLQLDQNDLPHTAHIDHYEPNECDRLMSFTESLLSTSSTVGVDATHQSARLQQLPKAQQCEQQSTPQSPVTANRQRPPNTCKYHPTSTIECDWSHCRFYTTKRHHSFDEIDDTDSSITESQPENSTICLSTIMEILPLVLLLTMGVIISTTCAKYTFHSSSTTVNPLTSNHSNVPIPNISSSLQQSHHPESASGSTGHKAPLSENETLDHTTLLHMMQNDDEFSHDNLRSSSSESVDFDESPSNDNMDNRRTTSYGYQSHYHSGSSKPTANANRHQQQMFAQLAKQYSVMRLRWISNSSVTCNDGTRAGYYVRHSPTSRRWLIYLEGGWYCMSKSACDQRWAKMREYMTSFRWSQFKTCKWSCQTNACL